MAIEYGLAEVVVLVAAQAQAYRDHATESGFQVPDAPTVMFTKWASCLTGPVTEVVLPNGGHTDWEVELVAIIGRLARNVSEADAWDRARHIAARALSSGLAGRREG